jgi:hypothetical protein
MYLPKHGLLFSQIRLNRYLKACENDPSKAVALYKLNIQASQALYPLISILEVALRNAIDRELVKHFKDNNWLLDQRHQFATHPDMVYKGHGGMTQPDHFFSDKLYKAEEKLNYRAVPITHGKLISELTFGFWVKFFDISSIKILRGVPLQAFLNKPHIKLALVHSHLNSLVTLRNRISHSEPICFDMAGNLCLATIQKYEENTLEALGWIDTELRNWAEKMNFFKPVFARISGLVPVAV